MKLQYNYKLETHLKILCDENKEFKTLWDTWDLNKNSCKQILKTILLNYPNFSMHDDSHSETVISNIELILGKERIELLSPTDTWLLLNTAYFHDLGMALLYTTIENIWGNEDFNDFLVESSYYNDKDLINSINYVNHLKENLGNKNFDKNWPIKIRKNVTFIISSYFRREHSSLSRQYIENAKNYWDFDMSHNGLINERFIKLISDISMIHTLNSNEILTLKYKSNGYNSDYIHPRFIAQLLRLGDLLDTDNNRFNKYLEFVEGEMPIFSQVHKNKHKSIEHILITPETICFKSNCHDPMTHNAIKKWAEWLEEELDFFSLNWNKIVPEFMTGSSPRLIEKEMLINNKIDRYGFTNLKFNISQEKAFDIICGSNIYSNKYIFLREVIQNSLDAIKIQLWRDLNDNIYSSKTLNKDSDEKYSYPFNVDTSVYENYYIKIHIGRLENTYIQIIIEDNGTGISTESLKNMCDVGSSYSKRERRKEIEKMPKWLRPTGGFGIGLQSIFLITNKFEIQTRAYNTALEIKIEKFNNENFFEVTELSEKINRGTKIILQIKNDESYRFSWGGLTDNYLSNFDPFNDDVNEGLIYKLIEDIRNYYNDINIPLQIYYKNELIDSLNFEAEKNYWKKKEKS